MPGVWSSEYLESELGRISGMTYQKKSYWADNIDDRRDKSPAIIGQRKRLRSVVLSFLTDGVGRPNSNYSPDYFPVKKLARYRGDADGGRLIIDGDEDRSASSDISSNDSEGGCITRVGSPSLRNNNTNNNASRVRRSPRLNSSNEIVITAAPPIVVPVVFPTSPPVLPPKSSPVPKSSPAPASVPRPSSTIPSGRRQQKAMKEIPRNRRGSATKPLTMKLNSSSSDNNDSVDIDNKDDIITTSEDDDIHSDSSDNRSNRGRSTSSSSSAAALAGFSIDLLFQQRQPIVLVERMERTSDSSHLIHLDDDDDDDDDDGIQILTNSSNNSKKIKMTSNNSAEEDEITIVNEERSFSEEKEDINNNSRRQPFSSSIRMERMRSGTESNKSCGTESNKSSTTTLIIVEDDPDLLLEHELGRLSYVNVKQTPFHQLFDHDNVRGICCRGRKLLSSPTKGVVDQNNNDEILTDEVNNQLEEVEDYEPPLASLISTSPSTNCPSTPTPNQRSELEKEITKLSELSLIEVKEISTARSSDIQLCSPSKDRGKFDYTIDMDWSKDGEGDYYCGVSSRMLDRGRNSLSDDEEGDEEEEEEDGERTSDSSDMSGIIDNCVPCPELTGPQDCHFCLLPFPSYHAMMDHFNEEHRKYQIKLMSEEWVKSELELQLEEDIRHWTELEENKWCNFCHKCLVNLDSRGFEVHIEEHYDDVKGMRKSQCYHCPAEFASESALAKHAYKNHKAIII